MEPAKKKWKGSYENSRQYNPKWGKEFSWLRKNSNGDAYCKYIVTVQLLRSTQHKATRKFSEAHVQSTGSSSKEVSDDVKTAELQLVVAMACHCSISAIDHLSDIIEKHGVGSKLGNIKIHRTKCTCLIKNVLFPSLKKDVVLDFKDKKY